MTERSKPTDRRAGDEIESRMPPFPIVDTHLHLYDPAQFTYAWLDGVPTLRHPHLPEDYLAAIGSIALEGGVFVEVAASDDQNLAETRWVTGLMPNAPWLRGVVANAPLEKGAAVRADLDELVQNPLVRGIRRLVSAPFRSDPDFCLRPEFVEGVRILAEYDLAFDLGIQKADLKKAAQLVALCPHVRFVVDHMANPDIVGGQLEPWRADLAELARAANVYCKLSGMIPNAGPTWTVESLTPYAYAAIEAFGFERVMFGSDWPVMKALGTDFRPWVDAVCQMVDAASEREQRQLFRETAIGFYRLSVSTDSKPEE